MKDSLLLTVALGYLAGKIKTSQIGLDELEGFVTDESLKPIDGQPHLTELKEALVDLTMFTYDIVGTMIKWDPNRVEEFMFNFGQGIAMGKITPLSIAVLCQVTHEDLKIMRDEKFKELESKL